VQFWLHEDMKHIPCGGDVESSKQYSFCHIPILEFHPKAHIYDLVIPHFVSFFHKIMISYKNMCIEGC
jgi:hypothetical protein